MIDKRTYEDLMNYLVKAECKRLKQQESTGKEMKHMGTPNQSLLKPSRSNSNLNSIKSSKKKQV